MGSCSLMSWNGLTARFEMRTGSLLKPEPRIKRFAPGKVCHNQKEITYCICPDEEESEGLIDPKCPLHGRKK